MTASLTHYTLNNGTTVAINQTDVAADLPVARQIISTGQLPAPLDRFRLRSRQTPGVDCWDFVIGSDRFDFCQGRVCGDQAQAAEAFRAMEIFYLAASDRYPDLFTPGAAPEQPATVPWLVTLSLPFLMAILGHHQRLATIQRAVAWILLEMTDLEKQPH